MQTSVNDQTNLTSLKFTSWLVRLLKPSTYLSLVLSEDTGGNSRDEKRVRAEKEKCRNRTKGRGLQAMFTT